MAIILAAIVAVALLAIAVFLTVPISSDVARAKVIEILADRLDSEVELDSLSLKVLPRLRAAGAGLTIRHKGRHDMPPLISIRSFAVEGDVFSVLNRHLPLVTVEGLSIQVPPRGSDGEDHDNRASEAQPPKSKRSILPIKSPYTIDKLVTADAQLVLIPRDRNKAPRTWAIHDLQMRSVSFDKAMPFDATLTNAVPPGEIATSGKFGPWQPVEPGDTPLEGTFTFADADLSVFNGISGILSAKGAFDGKLNRIEVHGDTTTPEFTLTDVGHPIPLRAKYDTVVDGTNGDTYLDRIDASWRNTSLVAKGQVVQVPEGGGREVDLDLTMDNARIEDLLWLSVKTPKPPMSGVLMLKTTMVLPPGKIDVVKKLHLNGTFTMSNARFTNLDVQKKIEALSQRSRGRDRDEQTEHVSSDFAGSFKLANGVLSIPTVAFAVPGSLVRLSGTYGVVSENINFKGTLFMDAKISETVGGFKSMLLKVVDPLFKGKHGGSEIPIQISGRRDNPSFGLDKGRIFKR